MFVYCIRPTVRKHYDWKYFLGTSFFKILVTENHNKKFLILFQNLRLELVYTVLYNQIHCSPCRKLICVIWMQHWSFADVNVMSNGILENTQVRKQFFTVCSYCLIWCPNLKIFWRKKSLYLLTHWKNGGSSAKNEHILRVAQRQHYNTLLHFMTTFFPNKGTRTTSNILLFTKW